MNSFTVTQVRQLVSFSNYDLTVSVYKKYYYQYRKLLIETQNCLLVVNCRIYSYPGTGCQSVADDWYVCGSDKLMVKLGDSGQLLVNWKAGTGSCYL